MGKEKAYIDGKNVSADWIEEIFDDFIRYGNNAESYIGVINDTPCGCTVYKTHILWWIKKTQSNAKTAYNTMMCRLLQRDMDETFSVSIFLITIAKIFFSRRNSSGAILRKTSLTTSFMHGETMHEVRIIV